MMTNGPSITDYLIESARLGRFDYVKTIMESDRKPDRAWSVCYSVILAHMSLYAAGFSDRKLHERHMKICDYLISIKSW